MKVSHLTSYGNKDGVPTGRQSLFFICPGCNEELHAATVTLPTVDDGGGRAQWSWNRSEDKPTLTPSLLITSAHGDKKTICHSLVNEGQIQFLGDCTHALAGQTVPLPPWPDGHLGIGVIDK